MGLYQKLAEGTCAAYNHVGTLVNTALSYVAAGVPKYVFVRILFCMVGGEGRLSRAFREYMHILAHALEQGS